MVEVYLYIRPVLSSFSWLLFVWAAFEIRRYIKHLCLWFHFGTIDSYTTFRIRFQDRVYFLTCERWLHIEYTDKTNVRLKDFLPDFRENACLILTLAAYLLISLPLLFKNSLKTTFVLHSLANNSSNNENKNNKHGLCIQLLSYVSFLSVVINFICNTVTLLSY